MPHPFWSYGFRPFFLLAGLFAALAIPLWLLQYTAITALPIRGGAFVWHVHEMLFAFGGAAIAGFLTTAVPNWTGTEPLAGRPVMLLTMVWIAGRAAWLVSDLLPGWLLATADLAFIPALMIAVGPALGRARQWRNLPVLLLILALFAGNVLHHAYLLDLYAPGYGQGTTIAIVAIVSLIGIIGGRIVPAFTRNALAARGAPADMRRWPMLDLAAVIAIPLAGAALLIVPQTAISGGLAALAAGLNLARLGGWRGWQTLGMPIVWVLHVAYLWIPVGFALLAAAELSDAVAHSAGWHALTAGAIATMILAVTTRAALGHTGRPLVAPPPIALAYALLTAAAATRVAASLGGPSAPGPLLYLSAGLWCGAFLIFVIVYAPILAAPRAERPAG